MEKELEKHLNVLNSERCLTKPKEAIIVIDKITECFNQNQSQFSIGLLIGMILDDSAIFSFIWKVSNNFETVPSVTAAFKLLDFLVTHFEKCIQPYFPILFEKSLHLMDTRFAKTKEVSLKLVKKLIVADSKNCLDLVKLVTKFETYLKEESKTSGTVAEQVFGLLGYIFEKYPEVVKKEEWFLQKICESLRKDLMVFKTSSSAREKGAFEAINGYLVNFMMPDTVCERVYNYIKSVSEFRPEKRLVGRAALKVLQNHWKNFSEYIYIDSLFWRKSLALWMKQKSEDRICAMGALHAFYTIVAICVKQQNDPIDDYVKEFRDIIQAEGSPYEKSAVLMGIKLFSLTDSLGDDFEEMYNLVMNFVCHHETNHIFLPSCVECVSAFVLKTGVRELPCLERLSVKIIHNYPKFEHSLNALNALEKSFYIIGQSSLETLYGFIERVLYQGLTITCSSMTQREYDILKESGSTPDAFTYKSYLSLWRYLLDLTNTPNVPIGGSASLKKGVAAKVFDAFMQSFLQILSKLNYSMNGSTVENESDIKIFINCVDLYEDLMQENDYIQKWANTILVEVIKLSYKNPLVTGFYKIVTKTLRISDYESDVLDKFLQSVLLKVDLYKGELQLACFRTILASPANLIHRHLDNVIPAIEVAVQIGRNCFSLLKDIIDELERWNCQLPSDVMEVLMQKILPHFAVFFQSQHFRGNDLVDKTIFNKKIKNEVSFTDSELLTLQKKFLLFLGHLGANKSVHLIRVPDTERDITDKRLIYHIPFLTGRTDLDLEELLPRIVDLSESCSDRNTRITACEVLYSVTMIVLGNINQLSGGYSSVFRKILKTSILLACDSDEIVYQIFEPLMYQIMHYFSSRKALNFSETNDLIDILMDYVTKPYDPAVRDFSAILLREFMSWTIKQHTPEELKTTPEVIKRILSKIYSLALHPSYNKRQGAAVVFNKIYTILREEELILNKYWFELYYYFMESLRMCDGPEDVSEIINAIQHIKRPIVEKHGQFNEAGDRITPPEFDGPLLKDLVKWTAERCSDVRTHMRRIAMSLVKELIPFVKIMDIYPQQPAISISLLKANSTQEEYANWLKHQISSFEYFSWLAENTFISLGVVCRLQRLIIINFAENIFEPRGVERESILTFINMLISIKERAFYFPKIFWKVIIFSVFKPTLFGFDLSHSLVNEQCSQDLIKLMSYLYTKLPLYHWNYFYDNLESVVIAPHFKHIIKSRRIGTASAEFLFSLKAIRGAGIWHMFSTRFSFQGIIKAIFRSLFRKHGLHVYAVTLEPTCRTYIGELLQLFFSTDDIFECLDDEEEVIEEETGKSIKKGLYFWLTFKEHLGEFLNAELLINKKEKKLEFMLDVIKSNKKMAKEIIDKWEVVLKEFQNQEVLKIAVAVGTGIGIPGCLKSTPVSKLIIKVEELQNEMFCNLLPYLSEVEEERNEVLEICLEKIEKSRNFIINLLQSLKQTGSLVVLRFILSRAAWFFDFTVKDIEATLNGFNNLTEPHVIRALELAYSFCFEDVQSNASITNIFKFFFEPMLKTFKNECVYEIIIKKMAFLGNFLSVAWNVDDLYSAKLNIIRKTFAAEMIQIFVTKFSKEELSNKPVEKRRLMDDTVKKSFLLLKLPSPPKVLAERYRKLMCAMFNMVCSVVAARCVEEQFYKLLVFDERGSFLFKAIDEDDIYNFCMEFVEIPHRTQHATAISCSSSTSRKYAQTDTLFTSSLREDVTQFDLTYASIQPRNTQMIELEMDKLNSHECMPMLVATISKMMQDVFRTRNEVPCWLRFFMFVLSGERFTNNHKFFVLKAMYNVQEYLKPYVGIVFPVFLDSMSLFNNQPINYFLIDLIEMMLTWEDLPWEEKSQRQLTELVVTFIEKCDFLRRDIIKNILGVVKTIIEKWKCRLFLEELSSIVFQRLELLSSEKNRINGRFDRFSFINLHTASILLANDIPAWKPNETQKFITILSSNFREQNETAELFANVYGMTLSYLERKNENIEEYVKKVQKILQKHSLNLLYHVHKHYPRIVDSFAYELFSSASNSTDSLTLKKLEMMLNYVSEADIDDTFVQNADKFLIDTLNSVDSAVQETSLQIILKILNRLQDDQIVLKEVMRLQKSIHPNVRKWVYEIAKKMFSKYPNQFREVLLRGLSESGELKQPCLDFWKSMKITDPLGILKQMYTPETEDIFLSNAIQILLHNAGGQYETYVFQNPIIEGRSYKRQLLQGTLHSHTDQSVEFTATMLNIQNLRPSVPLSFQPTVQPNTEVASNLTTLHNPHKKRFKKTEWKLIKKQIIEQKQDLDIYGEYAGGDYPDIRIKHEQVLRLLEKLSERDHHIARLLLVSLYNIRVSEDASDFFKEVLRTSKSFQPAVIGFVLQVVYKHRLNIDCDLISNAAISSNWLSLGALIIEDVIARNDIQDIAIKKPRGITPAEELPWLELSKLYRNLEEHDVLTGIFLDKISVSEPARLALKAETLLDYQTASSQYESILQSNLESRLTEFYTESYFNCLVKLSNWSFINLCLKSDGDNQRNIWNNYFLLSWFVHSEMMVSLNTDNQDFIETLRECCQNKMKLRILGANFGEELAVYDWLTGNLQKASYRIDRLCLDFLSNWSNMDQWAYNLRVNKLGSLQTLSELNQSVRALSGENVQPFWETMPTASDDLTFWDVKLAYRKQFIKYREDLSDIGQKSYFAMTKAALEQGNLCLAKESLRRTLPYLTADSRDEYEYYFNLGRVLLANRKMVDMNVGLDLYVNIFQSLSKEIQTHMDTSTNLLVLGQLIMDLSAVTKKRAKDPEFLNLLRIKLKTNDMMETLEQQGLEYLEKAEATTEKSEFSVHSLSYIYEKLIKFLLQTKLDDEKLAKYILRAMSLGDREARELFGVVLQKEISFADSEADKVPSWMFIMWINQILAALDSKIFPVLKTIVTRIADDHPNAIRFPYNALKNSKNSKNPKFKLLIDRLDQTLSNSLYDNFLTSLTYLAPPDVLLKLYLKKALESKSNDVLVELYQIMFSPEKDIFRGAVFKYWEQFEEPLKDAMAEKNQIVLVQKINNIMENITKPPPKRLSLEFFCPWLYSFHSLKTSGVLELPGQYGNHQPVKNPIAVTSFRNDILVFDTKCQPIRITVLGNDANDHRYLIKFGEDLRQDERVQQLLGHINYVLMKCKQTRQCHINTYKIMPLNEYQGMIRWVDNHVSLYDMIRSSLKDPDQIAKSQNLHLNKIASNFPITAHLIAYSTVTREESIINFNARVHDFPEDLLKQAFMRLSTSPEQFMYLRGNFAKSHAVMSITHWLLGIGDRHLQNTLVSTKTGHTLGIDFSYAFGFATHLTPPELIPFRLTPQILNLTDPFNESGWIKQTMIHALRVFRREPVGFRAILEVFIREPVIDWLKEAKKSGRCEKGEKWNPKERIEVIEKKLVGTNPVAVIEADLKLGHANSIYLEKFMEVLRGVKQHNIRARLKSNELSEDEEVECLIDLATDPHVLSKTYVGWNPWL